MRPRLLDLFCGAGGAAVGYDRAGFEVVGVDIRPQPRYPFEFHQADAMTFPLDGFDAIHASPPCQAYSQSTLSQRRSGHEYPELVPACRDRLAAIGLPWVIENVPNAPIRADFVLCGSQFGLQLVRHRWFEVSWGPLEALTLMPPCSHDRLAVTVTGHGTPSYVRNSRKRQGIVEAGYGSRSRTAMGIDWMQRDEISQAIPPAYTEWIGGHLLAAIRSTALTR